MTSTQHPTTTIELGAHLAAACFLMSRSGRDELSVTVDGGSREPIAVITATDIARFLARGRTLENTRISDLVRPRHR